MTNTIFEYNNPNPPTIEPVPDPNKPRCIKVTINEEENHEPKRFVLVRNEMEQEPAQQLALKQQGE
jgi:hypothetical protein